MNKNILFLGSAILVFALIGFAQAIVDASQLELNPVTGTLQDQAVQDFNQSIRGTWQVSSGVPYYLCKNGVQNNLDSNCWVIPHDGEAELQVGEIIGTCVWEAVVDGTAKTIVANSTINLGNVVVNNKFGFRFSTTNTDQNCGIIANNLWVSWYE